MEDPNGTAPKSKPRAKHFDADGASAEDFVAHMRGIGLPI